MNAPKQDKYVAYNNNEGGLMVCSADVPADDMKARLKLAVRLIRALTAIGSTSYSMTDTRVKSSTGTLKITDVFGEAMSDVLQMFMRQKQLVFDLMKKGFVKTRLSEAFATTQDFDRLIHQIIYNPEFRALVFNSLLQALWRTFEPFTQVAPAITAHLSQRVRGITADRDGLIDHMINETVIHVDANDGAAQGLKTLLKEMEYSSQRDPSANCVVVNNSRKMMKMMDKENFTLANSDTHNLFIEENVKIRYEEAELIG
eukprot:GHVN01000124.1.p1 GENE.GHVN01000124.1~~GHVN01000124.1.p1  ORF type:complete len:258 (-),score=56.89 GHVN01000124.1:4-777(-)